MFKQRLPQRAGGGTEGLGPVQPPPRRPLQGAVGGGGPMFGPCGRTPRAGAAARGGEAVAFAEDFDRGGGEAHGPGLAHEARGDTIEVSLRFEMIIEMDTGAPPVGILLGRREERLESRVLRGQEVGVARARQFLERAGREGGEQGISARISLVAF
jgi:hypothetical protein